MMSTGMGIDVGTAALLSGQKNDGMGLGGGLIGGLLLGGLLGGNNRGGLFGGNGYGGGAATAAVATDLLLQPLITSTQQQISALTNQVNSNAMNETVSDGISGTITAIANVNDNLNGTTRDIIAGQAALSSNLAQANFTTLNSINGLGRDTIVTANQNALTALNSANIVNTTMLQGFNEIGRDANISTSQIIAGQTAAAYAMAQCCCEIKQAVYMDGSATRALITDNRMADQSNTINALSSKVSDMEQTNIILSQLRPNHGGGHHVS
jgi:hypothetical protein